MAAGIAFATTRPRRRRAFPTSRSRASATTGGSSGIARGRDDDGVAPLLRAFERSESGRTHGPANGSKHAAQAPNTAARSEHGWHGDDGQSSI